MVSEIGLSIFTTPNCRRVVQLVRRICEIAGSPIHRSKLTTRALAQRTWLTLEWLPKYAPELNDIERCWRDLKQHYLANCTFTDADALACAIPDAVARLNYERQTYPSPIPIRSA
jgi:transposase